GRPRLTRPLSRQRVGLFAPGQLSARAGRSGLLVASQPDRLARARRTGSSTPRWNAVHHRGEPKPASAGLLLCIQPDGPAARFWTRALAAAAFARRDFLHGASGCGGCFVVIHRFRAWLRNLISMLDQKPLRSLPLASFGAHQDP